MGYSLRSKQKKTVVTWASVLSSTQIFQDPECTSASSDTSLNLDSDSDSSSDASNGNTSTTSTTLESSSMKKEDHVDSAVESLEDIDEFIHSNHSSSEYLKNRLKNIQANQQLFKNLDLTRLSDIIPKSTKNSSLSELSKSKKKLNLAPLRRSSRKKNSDPEYLPSLSDLEDEDQDLNGSSRSKKKKNENGNDPTSSRKGYTLTHCPSMQSFSSLPYLKHEGDNEFGSIPGIPVGALFPFRIDCSRAGIHRPTVAGIHGKALEGCYSICVSGGYPEDIDEGNRIQFTGSGGRYLKGTKENPKNLRTAPQDHDMELNTTNQSLITSFREANPIRVVRGPKSHFHHAPIGCYRYEGLYRCTSYSYERGSSNYFVYLFTLERLPNQPDLTSLPRSMDDPLFIPIRNDILNFRTSMTSSSTSSSSSFSSPTTVTSTTTKKVSRQIKDSILVSPSSSSTSSSSSSSSPPASPTSTSPTLAFSSLFTSSPPPPSSSVSLTSTKSLSPTSSRPVPWYSGEKYKVTLGGCARSH